MNKQMLMLTFLLVSSVLCAQAQTLSLLNGQFENWTTVNGTDYPNDWNISDTSEVKKYISKVTDAGEGSFAIRFDSYSGLEAPYVEIGDTIPDGVSVDQIEFKVKTDRISNPFTDGAVIRIVKYNKDWDYLAEQIIRISDNTRGWVGVTQRVSLGSTKYLLVSLELWDFSKSGAYAIFDDIKFTKKTVGIAKTEDVVTAKIYPNPVSDYFVIESETPITTLKIINHLGQTVKRIDTPLKSEQIDVTDLAIGVYTVQATIKDGGVISKKLVKE